MYFAVQNALDPHGFDYSNGGCYWDGIDLKTKGSGHRHYKIGYKFTDPAHDVLDLGNTPPKYQTKRGRVRYYTYQSTAGYGQTVFWEMTPEFTFATGTPLCH